MLLVDYQQTVPIIHSDSAGYDLPRSSVLLAQGQGRHLVRVDKAEEPFRRFDGKKSRYSLVLLELSETCNSPNDEAWACVVSGERQWWTPGELADIGINVRRTKEGVCSEQYSIFEHIQF
ncbi:hypothetical protein [Alteromonas sp. 14N.309.X.WAT.G.H12]|uniref:hypothetical protein n=1 Tax=Alteromonas sp. 14N.309.X.WAT.G.H12 TaxID=3120824 RepID=UPI002FCFC396